MKRATAMLLLSIGSALSIGCAPSETSTLFGHRYDEARGCFGPATRMEEVPGPSERVAVDQVGLLKHLPTGTLWWVPSESYIRWLSRDWRLCGLHEPCPHAEAFPVSFCSELDLADAGTD